MKFYSYMSNRYYWILKNFQAACSGQNIVIPKKKYGGAQCAPPGIGRVKQYTQLRTLHILVLSRKSNPRPIAHKATKSTTGPSRLYGCPQEKWFTLGPNEPVSKVRCKLKTVFSVCLEHLNLILYMNTETIKKPFSCCGL